MKKIEELLEGSPKIRLSMLRSALDLDKSTFDSKIFKWAKDFNFKIDGDFFIKEEELVESELIIEKVKEWEVQYCNNCGGKILDRNQKICEYCGKEL